jgi:hypothetical protein
MKIKKNDIEIKKKGKLKKKKKKKRRKKKKSYAIHMTNEVLLRLPW